MFTKYDLEFLSIDLLSQMNYIENIVYTLNIEIYLTKTTCVKFSHSSKLNIFRLLFRFPIFRVIPLSFFILSSILALVRFLCIFIVSLSKSASGQSGFFYYCLNFFVFPATEVKLTWALHGSIKFESRNKQFDI